MTDLALRGLPRISALNLEIERNTHSFSLSRLRVAPLIRPCGDEWYHHKRSGTAGCHIREAAERRAV